MDTPGGNAMSELHVCDICTSDGTETLKSLEKEAN